jgi:hypothetical protein
MLWLASLLNRIGQKRNVAGALNGLGHQALVFGTIAGYPPRQDLAAFSDKAAQLVGFLVFDGYGLIDAEATHAFFGLTGAFAQKYSSSLKG